MAYHFENFGELITKLEEKETSIAVLETQNSLLNRAIDNQTVFNRDLGEENSLLRDTIKSQQIRLGNYARELIRKDELIDEAVVNMETSINSLLKAN